MIKDKHIGLIGKIDYEWIAMFLAIVKSGAAVIPLDYSLSLIELRKMNSLWKADVLLSGWC